MRIKKNHSNKTKKYFELCKKQVKNTPDDPKAHYDLGLMYKASDNIEEALACFETAIKLMHSTSIEMLESKLMYATILISLAETLIKKKDYKQAMLYLNEGINIFPESPILLSLIGRVYKECSQFMKAIEFYQRASNAKPDAEGIHHNLVDLYIMTEQPEKAIAQLNTACKYLPKSAIIL